MASLTNLDEIIHLLSKITFPSSLEDDYESLTNSAFLNFSAINDINGAVTSTLYTLPIDVSHFESALKSQIIEIITSIQKGLPAARTTRTYIEAVARYTLLLRANSLIINKKLRRSNSEVANLESAATTKKASKLTKCFSQELKSSNLEYISLKFTDLYATLNDITHGNPNLQYQSAIRDYIENLPSALEKNIKMVIQTFLIATYLLIFEGQNLALGTILSREQFYYLERKSFIPANLLELIR